MTSRTTNARIAAVATTFAAGVLAAFALRPSTSGTSSATLARPQAAEVRTQVIRRTVHIVRHERPPRPRNGAVNGRRALGRRGRGRRRRAVCAAHARKRRERRRGAHQRRLDGNDGNDGADSHEWRRGNRRTVQERLGRAGAHTHERELGRRQHRGRQRRRRQSGAHAHERRRRRRERGRPR